MSEDHELAGQAPDRVVRDGIFPFSPRANARAGIFNDILATVLGSEPSASFEEFEQHFLTGSGGEVELENDIDPELVWDVYCEKYTTTTRGGNQVPVSFVPEVAERIKPPFSRNWGRWYRLHFSRVEGNKVTFDPEGVHKSFRDEILDLSPSNIFEQALREYLVHFESSSREEEVNLSGIRPYIPEVERNFTEDLKAWIKCSTESDSDRLRDCQDLIGIHFFMYYIQVSVNLRKEWEMFLDSGKTEPYEPEMIPIPYGVESENAGIGRQFVRIWEGEKGAPYSVKNDIYDSYARLAVTRILDDAIRKNRENPRPYPYTLTEAQLEMSASEREEAVSEMFSNLKDIDPPDEPDKDDLIDAAQRLVTAIHKYYEEKDSGVAPRSMGIRGVNQLAKYDGRYLKQRHGRPGERFQMADETLAFLARMFASNPQREDGNRSFSEFIKYLEDRGFDLDPTSQQAAQRTLDSMGLLEQESDSGETVNVRTY